MNHLYTSVEDPDFGQIWVHGSVKLLGQTMVTYNSRLPRTKGNLKFPDLYILDNFESIFSCNHNFGLRRPLDALEPWIRNLDPGLFSGSIDDINSKNLPSFEAQCLGFGQKPDHQN